MRKFILAVLAATLIAQPLLAQVRVKGYVKKDGTYVAPHYRSAPDGNRFNNYSARGNINPYTGKAGTVDPLVPKVRFAPSLPTFRVGTVNAGGDYAANKPTYVAPGLTVPKYIPPNAACSFPC